MNGATTILSGLTTWPVVAQEALTDGATMEVRLKAFRATKRVRLLTQGRHLEVVDEIAGALMSTSTILSRPLNKRLREIEEVHIATTVVKRTRLLPTWCRRRDQRRRHLRRHHRCHPACWVEAWNAQAFHRRHDRHSYHLGGL
jgi:hypothetical protein